MKGSSTMKKIIKAKLYDTDTAKLVGEWDNNYSTSDFSFCQEGLYLKKTGEYFLFGKGGANSIYSEKCEDNSWSGGRRIIPLSYGSARTWAEEHLDAEEYQQAFGEIIESDDYEIMPFSILKSTKERLRRLSSETGKPMNELIDTACRAMLDA
jgi:hypothetical protein